MENHHTGKQLWRIGKYEMSGPKSTVGANRTIVTNLILTDTLRSRSRTRLFNRISNVSLREPVNAAGTTISSRVAIFRRLIHEYEGLWLTFNLSVNGTEWIRCRSVLSDCLSCLENGDDVESGTGSSVVSRKSGTLAHWETQRYNRVKKRNRKNEFNW